MSGRRDGGVYSLEWLHNGAIGDGLLNGRTGGFDNCKGAPMDLLSDLSLDVLGNLKSELVLRCSRCKSTKRPGLNGD